MMNLQAAICLVKSEVTEAQWHYPAFHSEHEGFAVFKEEADELWDAVKLKQSNPDRTVAIRREAAHAAAMAIRILIDCCEEDTTLDGVTHAAFPAGGEKSPE